METPPAEDREARKTPRSPESPSRLFTPADVDMPGFVTAETFGSPPQYSCDDGGDPVPDSIAVRYRQLIMPTNGDDPGPRTPIVLLHGDFHTGKIWDDKPDKRSGWADFFLKCGYVVWTVDMPGAGRSASLGGEERTHGYQQAGMLMRRIFQPHNVPGCAWNSAETLNKWPKDREPGQKAPFRNYLDMLVPLQSTRFERQAVGQDAIVSFLKFINQRCILIGEGSGCQIAWLAADVVPDLVAGIVAVEPSGPPFGSASGLMVNGEPVYENRYELSKSLRVYGLTDIPITFDPPVDPPSNILEGLDDSGLSFSDHFLGDPEPNVGPMLYLEKRPFRELKNPASKKVWWAQKEKSFSNPAGVRQLKNIKKVHHLVITASGSEHSVYDHATVLFMKQAGCDKLIWKRLGDFGITGNSRLMFLETNSDQIAQLINSWIRNTVVTPLPKPSAITLVPEVQPALPSPVNSQEPEADCIVIRPLDEP